MPTLTLICGLPGAGKTTLARQLERELPALRLCPDLWIAAVLASPQNEAELHRLRDPVERLQWEVAARALALGINVILEWGFWSRAERREYRCRGEKLGAEVKLYVLEVEREELWARLSQRNAALPPETFRVTRERLEAWFDLFEPPESE